MMVIIAKHLYFSFITPKQVDTHNLCVYFWNTEPISLPSVSINFIGHFNASESSHRSTRSVEINNYLHDCQVFSECHIWRQTCCLKVHPEVCLQVQLVYEGIRLPSWSATAHLKSHLPSNTKFIYKAYSKTAIQLTKVMLIECIESRKHKR